MIRYFGYPVEEHEVFTEDGYILTLHRIPHGLDENSHEKGRPVAFLGHCLVGSSAIWTFGPRDNSLGYMLADAGYDVWMINIRGNSFSKRHKWLDSCPTCSEFWSFGFDESARLDYSATIDYILDQTGQSQVYFVGYSMGTTQYLILLSEMPEYNAKIKAGFLLGPSALVGNATNPLVNLADQAELLQSVFQLLGMDEFMPNFLEVKSNLAHKICRSSYLHSLMCRNLWALIVNSDPSHINPEAVPTYLSQLPAGASTTTFVHYAQLFRSGGKFQKFDYGALKNIVVYGSSIPPEYDLSQVQAPTMLYVGDADGFAGPQDTQLLAESLPNLIGHEIVPRKGWSHLDFVTAANAGDLVYKDIINRMNSLNFCHMKDECE